MKKSTQQCTRKRPRREANPSLLLPCWRYPTTRPQRQLVKKKRKARTTSEQEKHTQEFCAYIRGNSKQTEYNKQRKQKQKQMNNTETKGKWEKEMGKRERKPKN